MKNAVNDRPMYEKAIVLKDRLYGIVRAYLQVNQSKEWDSDVSHYRACILLPRQ
jgi:hypothetical protein